MMRTIRLGTSDVRVTALGFGAAPIAGLYEAVDDETARAAIEAAWDAGIRYFDTAPHYGLGLSEVRLGRALSTRPRGGYVVSTKVGRLLVPETAAPDRRDLAHGFDIATTHRRRWDFSADGVRRSYEASLTRLDLDRIDVVLLHDPDDHWRQALEEAYPALHDLRMQHVIGAIGVGMNQWQMLADFVREVELDVVLLAGRYTLLDQSALDVLLPLCLQRSVTVVAAGVFNSGLLASDDPAEGGRFNYRAAPPEVLERARRIAAVCASHGISLPQAALAFPFGHPAVGALLVGMRSVVEVVKDVQLANRPVPPDLWGELVADGLLRPDAPAPRRGTGPLAPG